MFDVGVWDEKTKIMQLIRKKPYLCKTNAHPILTGKIVSLKHIECAGLMKHNRKYGGSRNEDRE